MVESMDQVQVDAALAMFRRERSLRVGVVRRELRAGVYDESDAVLGGAEVMGGLAADLGLCEGFGIEDDGGVDWPG